MNKPSIVIVNKRTGKERPVSASRVLSPLGEQRFDGWQSLATGLGTSADKRMSNTVQWQPYTMEFYEQCYSGDEQASRIVDIIPDDALRNWIELKGYEKNILDAAKKKMSKLDVRGSCERAWKWGRAFGGAVQYVVTDCVDPSQPLDIESEKVLALREMSRYDLRLLTTDIETDFGSPNYGQPNIYYLNVQIGTNVKLYPIHWTRVIRYDGKLVPRRTYIRNNYWHDSILQRLFNVIRNYQTSNDAAASIMQDFNVGVIKMKDLANFMSAGKEDIVKRRVETMNYSKSVIKAMLIDADSEEFTDLSRNVTGLPEMLDHMARRFVAATDIPHTKMLGESPDGSNATGNSTMQLWQQYIASEQNNYLRPKLNRLFEILFYDMPELSYTFNKLHQLSEKEEADVKYTTAQTDAIYVADGVLDPSEIAKSRFGGDDYSTETRLDLEARQAGLIGSMHEAPDFSGENDAGSGDDGSEDGKSKSDGEENDFPPEDKESSAGNPDKAANGKGAIVYNPWEDEGEEEEGKLPASLQERESNPNGLEVDRLSGQWSLQNNEIPSHVDKQTSFISQGESLPFRDPKTDPRTPPPGRMKQRAADMSGEYSAAGGSQRPRKDSTDSSLSQRRDAGESSLMPRQLDSVKTTKQKIHGTSVVVQFGNYILLGKRRDTGAWALPGGVCEMGETAKLAARRELWEETGLRYTKLMPMANHETPTAFVATFRCIIPTTGRKDEFPAVDFSKDPDQEFTELQWVDISEGLPAEIAGNLHHKPSVGLLDVGLGKSDT